MHAEHRLGTSGIGECRNVNIHTVKWTALSNIRGTAVFHRAAIGNVLNATCDVAEPTR